MNDWDSHQTGPGSGSRRFKTLESLSALAASMPKVVREHEILRVAALVHSEDPRVSAEATRKEVLVWAQNRSGGLLPEEAWKFRDFEYYSGGRNSLGVRIEAPSSDLWAIRADDPDKTVPGRVWTTEVVVGFTGHQPCIFSARLLASTSEDKLQIQPHTPGFVQQIAEKYALSRGCMVLDSDPWIIESEYDAEALSSLRQAHEAFIFGTPFAALVLMRSLMEAVLRDHYNHVSSTKRRIDLKQRIDSAQDQLPRGASAAALHRLRQFANAAVHLDTENTRDLPQVEAKLEREIISLLFVLRALIEGAPQQRSPG